MAEKLPLQVPKGGLFGYGVANNDTTSNDDTVIKNDNKPKSKVKSDDSVKYSTNTNTKRSTKHSTNDNTKDSTDISTKDDTTTIDNVDIGTDTITVTTTIDDTNTATNNKYAISIPKKSRYLDSRKQRSHYIKTDNLKQMDKLVKTYGFNKSDIVNQALELFFVAFEDYIKENDKEK